MAKRMDEARVPYAELDRFTCNVLIRLGVPPQDAQTTADVLSQANLRGVETHGSDLLPIYVKRISNGLIKPRPRIKIVKHSPATALIDGDRGLGQATTVFAMREAIKKANQVGIGWVNVINSNHQGALAYYSLLAANEGMIGITSSTTSKVMSPWGSREPVAPNTPIAFAAPTSMYKPVVLDMATSVLAFSKVRLSRERNVPLPDEMALDEQGNVTIDPLEAVAALPFGAYKGSGLMMMFTILAGLLGGGPFTANRSLSFGEAEPAAAQVAHLVVAIDIGHFTGVAEFKSNLDDVIATWKSAARRPGFGDIHYPGEIEWDRVPERERNGIPLNGPLLRQLRKIAGELGVRFPATG